MQQSGDANQLIFRPVSWIIDSCGANAFCAKMHSQPTSQPASISNINDNEDETKTNHLFQVGSIYLELLPLNHYSTSAATSPEHLK